MSKLDKNEVLANYTEAYKAANGKEPQIEAKSGWYSVDGGKNVRLATLVEMTEELKSGSATEAAAPAAEEKKEAAPAKKAKKATPKKAAGGSGMSPKDAWLKHLAEQNQSAKPRGF